jgi:hypothetical protein
VTRIVVTTAYRPKRPRKRKAVAIAGPAIVRKRGRAAAVVPPDRGEKPTPANDDRKPAIATSISRKRSRLQRAEPEPDDPEADAAMRAWLERAKWGHGPAR